MSAPALRLWGTPVLNGSLRFGAERRFQLLAVLGLQAGQWVERDRLGALLWPDRGSSEARRNLRKVVFGAHELPGLEGLEGDGHALRWTVASDVAAFHAARGSDPAAALAWRQGVPLAGIDDTRNAAFAQWLAAERARLEQAWLATACAWLARLPDPAERAAFARRMLEIDALDEVAMEALLRAELALGHGAQAQAAYRRYATALAQELGVEPARALRELLAAPPPPAAAAVAVAPPDTFIGRRLELAELRRLLAHPPCRLLTVLGPGGAGKSCLARRALHDNAASFGGRCAWVPLQDTLQAAELPARLAQVLGLPLGDSPAPLASLLQRWIGAETGRALLVLDNAEHLLHGAAALPPLLAEALAAAPGLVLLLTSRARCGLPGEWLLPLAGLAVPDADSRDLEAAASFDAVRLFERCAGQAQRSFELAAHLDAAIAVCEAVGGLPLAIELAASWVRLLPPATIAADIRAGAALDLLERDPAGPPPARAEHRSLRAVLQGSWQLLGAHEQQALAALAVFEGGFTHAAARSVAQCSLPLLSALSDVSLLHGEHGRFSLHPVVREYAAERLDADVPRRAALRERHAAHYAGWLAEQAPLARREPGALVAAVAQEDANVCRAWRHALAQRQHGTLQAMAPALRLYREIGGRLAEGVGELQAALDVAEADGAVALQAALQHALSALLYRRGQPVRALAVAQAGIESAERCGDRAALKGCLNNAGLVLWHLGRAGDALAPLARALAEAEADGDLYGVAVALANGAIAKKALGRFEEALADTQRTLDLAHESGNPQQVCSRMNNVGNLYRALGRWAQARPVFAEALRVAQAHGLTAAQQYPQLNAALVDIELGRLDAARAGLQAVLDAQVHAPQELVALNAALGLVRVDILCGGPAADAPRRLLLTARRALQQGFPTHAVQALTVWAEWLWARGRHDTAIGLWHWAAGHEALDEADRLVARRHLQRAGAAEPPAAGCWQPADRDAALALLAAEAG